MNMDSKRPSASPRICVVGLGYIGLPTSAILASRKIRVVGVDVNPTTVDAINRGRIHIVEPDLDLVVSAAVNLGYLRATTQPEAADIFLIAVPTPLIDLHRPDLGYVEAASRAVASVLKKGDLVILESTSPVGTTERMAEWMAEIRPDLTFPQTRGEGSDVRVAYCPERVLPGHILRELVQNDRVIGGLSPRCAAAAVGFYKLFVSGECLATNTRMAEMCKLAENSFRDVNIAFANELSLICEKLDINVRQLIQLANRHPRVQILNPGPGVGGHCIAVDPWFIVDSAPELAKVITCAREVNDARPLHVLDQILVAAARIQAPKIACFGLAFKADVDDLRESPALQITVALADRGLAILVVEPFISQLPASLNQVPNVSLVDAQQALELCDIAVCLVDHSEFKRIDPKLLQDRILIDTRGIWEF